MKKSAMMVMVVAIMCTGCAKKLSEGTAEAPSQPIVSLAVDRIEGGQAAMLPKAVVYKTNGNYNDKVAVRLNPEGTALTYFPAPTDISGNSSPVEIADGYLLDRQGGIGANTAFLDYSYRQYAALPSAPSPEELMAHIIPDARVTVVKVLPITLNEALRSVKELKDPLYLSRLLPQD